MTDQHRDFPTINDPLGETLHQLRLDGSLYCRCELTAPWGIEMPVMPGQMMFHIVTAGRCWLRLPDRSMVELQQGWLVLLPQGQGHSIHSDPDAQAKPLFDIPVERLSERYEIMRQGGGGVAAELTCGVIGFDSDMGRQLLQQLPESIVIDSWNGEDDQWMHSTLRLIAAEARSMKAGGATILTHLADILVLQAIRTWIETRPSEGWLKALGDPRIGKALSAMHRHPGENWTLTSLGQLCGLSRSAFAAHFRDTVGETVNHYLTRVRMQVASDRLRHSRIPLAELAESVGYGSEAAFCRAFKRLLGETPGQVRRLAVNNSH